MREELLHFIWRHRYFNQQHLFTEAGESLQILFPGELHRDQGPDCRNAVIRIGGQVCTGPVEIHIRASDWVRHAHDNDDHYRDTILHVVWENDWRTGAGKPLTPGGIPILTLHQRVPKLLLDRYDRWMKAPGLHSLRGDRWGRWMVSSGRGGSGNWCCSGWAGGCNSFGNVWKRTNSIGNR